MASLVGKRPGASSSRFSMLLIVGVFIVGMVRQVIRYEWIEAVAGNLAPGAG